jgi:hypothetical protein
MILIKSYGKTTLTAAASVLMALSMIINESLVARTFGSYTLQLFDVEKNSLWMPALPTNAIKNFYLFPCFGMQFCRLGKQLTEFIEHSRQ